MTRFLKIMFVLGLLSYLLLRFGAPLIPGVQEKIILRLQSRAREITQQADKVLSQIVNLDSDQVIADWRADLERNLEIKHLVYLGGIALGSLIVGYPVLKGALRLLNHGLTQAEKQLVEAELDLKGAKEVLEKNSHEAARFNRHYRQQRLS